MRFRSCLILAFVVCGFAASGWSQTRAGCQSRDVIVNVRDAKGNFVDGLPLTSFQATINHLPIRVVADKAINSGARVVLLVDLSGSMRLKATKFAAEHFVANQSGVLRIAMVTFSDRILETFGFGSLSRDILQHLERSDKLGRTSLYDSIAYAADMFHEPELGDAIYVISDGGDNRSNARPAGVGRLLESKGIRLFWFDIYDRYFPTEEQRLSQSDMKWLTGLSGGLAVESSDDPIDRRSFHELANGIYGSMKNFYDLSLELPVGADDRHSWSLEVLDNRTGKLKGVRVYYQKFYPTARWEWNTENCRRCITMPAHRLNLTPREF
jgi:hypothetical protein